MWPLTLPEAGYLVISTRYDSAWRAEVDGKDADIVRADGILMAVPVEAGRHNVTLWFDPAKYRWGKRRTSIADGDPDNATALAAYEFRPAAARPESG